MPAAILISAEQVAAVTDAFADRIADLVRRLGCPPGSVAAVVQRSGLALVEAASREPERVRDLLGRWVSDARRLTARVRSEGAAAPAEEDGTTAAVSGSDVVDTEAALSGLDERRRVALLLRDSYDASAVATAVALGLTADEAETVIAEARLRLLERRDGGPVPSLAQHAPLAGISLASLGAMADGGADNDDPLVRTRRRHAGSCELCAAVLDAQTRARVALAGLPVRGLPEAVHATVVSSIVSRAQTLLPSAEEVAEVVGTPSAIFPRWLVPGALLIAAIIGAGIGGILHASSHPSAPPNPSGTGVVTVPSTASPLDSPTAEETATATASASASLSPSAPATTTPPTASASPSRTPAPTRAASSAPVRTSAPATRAAPSSTAPVVAALSLSPTSGPAGTVITVTGTGFAKGAVITVTYSHSDGTSNTVSTSSDTQGRFTTQIAASDMTLLTSQGQHTVTASDGASSASAGFDQTS